MWELRFARGLPVLLLIAAAAAACSGKTVSDSERGSTDGGGETGGTGAGGTPASFATGGGGSELSPSETGGTGAGGTPAPPATGGGGSDLPPKHCGSEGELCCPGSTLLLSYPCSSPLVCCGDGACHLSCEAQAALSNDWDPSASCDLSSYKSCETIDDCVLHEHRINCCGSTRLTGIASEHESVLKEMVERCVKTMTCDCEVRRMEEKGNTWIDADMGGVTPFLECLNGLCTSNFIIR